MRTRRPSAIVPQRPADDVARQSPGTGRYGRSRHVGDRRTRLSTPHARRGHDAHQDALTIGHRKGRPVARTGGRRGRRATFEFSDIRPQ
ncbi:MAG TPA: hypothetical protein VKJ47_08695 [Candidatus Binatia bacterium]|nr:hypothetical protein [Candidatus Binatia bacterium]